MALLRVGPHEWDLHDVEPDPSKMDWGLQDVSLSDAGRVQDSGNTMYKCRVSQKRKLQLAWAQLTPAQMTPILQAFNPEYFFVQYYDPLEGRLAVREFYAGDRSAPVQMWLAGRKHYTTLSFNIIER